MTVTGETSVWLDLLGAEYACRYYGSGDFRTRVLEAGSGEPLILLHGTGGHAETYCRNLQALSQDFRVLAIDLIGHGFSSRPDVEYSLDDYADHVVALLDALGLQAAHISGESLGAMVGAWVAIRNPDRVLKLVMNTGTLVRPGDDGLAELGDLEARTKALAENLTVGALRKRMEWLVRDPATMTDELVACRHRIYSQPGMMDTVQRVMKTVQAMVRGTYSKDYFEPGILQQITCPTLVLWTENNPGQNLAVAEAGTRDIKDCRMQVLTDAAHWPQFENPTQFNRLHREFLSE